VRTASSADRPARFRRRTSLDRLRNVFSDGGRQAANPSGFERQAISLQVWPTCVPAFPGAAPIFGNSDGQKLARCVLSVPAKPGPHRRVIPAMPGSRIRSFHVERIGYLRGLPRRRVAILEEGQLVEIYIEREKEFALVAAVGRASGGQPQRGPAVRPDGSGPAGPAEEAGVPGGFNLARSGVDRASHHRADLAWVAATWADESTRVLVLDHGQALVDFTDGAAALEWSPRGRHPRESGFLLGVGRSRGRLFRGGWPQGGLGAARCPRRVPAPRCRRNRASARPGCARPGVARRPGRRAVHPRGRAGQLARDAHPLPAVRRGHRAHLAGHAGVARLTAASTFPGWTRR